MLATIVSGNSADGYFVRAYVRELTEHIGGKPTIVQRRLIERAAMLALHLLKFDQRAHRVGELSDRSMRDYLAAHNSLTRTLQAIGVQASNESAVASPEPEPKPEPESVPDLAGYLQCKASSREPSL